MNGLYMNKLNLFLIQLIDKILKKASKHTHLIIVVGGIYILFFGFIPIIDCSNEHCKSLGNWLSNVTSRIDHVTIWLAALTFLYASRIWQREVHDNEEITITLINQDNPNQNLVLPYKPIRKQCTRAEVQGILGNFYRMEDDKEKNNQLDNQTPIEQKSEQGSGQHPNNNQNKKQSDNYSTAGLSSPAYFKNLKEIELGDKEELVIYFSEKDWNKFKENIDKFNQQISNDTNRT